MVLNILNKIWLSFIFAIMVVWRIIIWPYTRIVEERKFKKRLEELRKRDPFIYK